MPVGEWMIKFRSWLEERRIKYRCRETALREYLVKTEGGQRCLVAFQFP